MLLSLLLLRCRGHRAGLHPSAGPVGDGPAQRLAGFLVHLHSTAQHDMACRTAQQHSTAVTVRHVAVFLPHRPLPSLRHQCVDSAPPARTAYSLVNSYLHCGTQHCTTSQRCPQPSTSHLCCDVMATLPSSAYCLSSPAQPTTTQHTATHHSSAAQHDAAQHAPVL